MIHQFETSTQWKASKEGTISAPELPDLDVASPPVFGGREGTWTPEHLFVAAAEVCLMTTFLAIAELSKLAVRGYRSRARGTLEKVEGEGLQFTSILVFPNIELENEKDAARAKRNLEKAEAHCLISKSMKTPVRIEASIQGPMRA